MMTMVMMSRLFSVMMLNIRQSPPPPLPPRKQLANSGEDLFKRQYCYDDAVLFHER